MAIYQVEVQVNNRRPKKLNAYTGEFYNFIESLNFKYGGWEEFVLSSQKGKIKLRFLKFNKKLQKFSKNRDLMHLTLYLDRNYPNWTRFVISKKQFEEVPYEQCESNMLVRVGVSSNTGEYLFIEDTNTNKDGSKELICYQEGERTVLNARKHKRSKFSVLMQNVDHETVTDVMI